MSPSYGLILQRTKEIQQKHIVFYMILRKMVKTIRNSVWSTPPELIFVSFESRESPLSNGAKITVRGVDHAEIWATVQVKYGNYGEQI